MTRVHDMGGRFGDGQVIPDSEVEVFHEDWHARALALTVAAGGLGQWTLDASRHARECLNPQDYARFHYYEKWLAGLADIMVAKGVITPEELAGAVPPEPSPLSSRMLKGETVVAALSKGGPTEREGPTPRFAVGDPVKVNPRAENAKVPGGHTRLPSYAAGTRGRIMLSHGCHVFPDTNAHGLGECPEPLYSVAIRSADLWQAPEHRGDEVILDLWESYLEPAA